MPTYYNTAVVQAAAQALDPFTPWLRNTFFGNTVMFDTKEILFDKVGRRRKIAPFVSPNLPGKERKQRGGEVRAYEPPYLKPKTTLDPDGSQIRRAGEGYGGDMSMLDRHEMQVQEVLADHDNEIAGQEERMCAQLLSTGHVTAEGDGISDDISYGRDTDLTVALVGAARWGEAGVNIINDLKAWKRLVGGKSGSVVRDVVLGHGASEIFTSDANVREVLDNRRQASGELAMAASASGGLDDVATLLGVIDGFAFWEYYQTYEDDAGNDQMFFPENGVSLVGQQFQGTMCYGAIKDVTALRAEARYAKEDIVFDPSGKVLITESAPLPVPVNPNASFFASVR